MFRFKKPKAIINISMQTGNGEAISVSVNAYKLDRHSIFHALNEAASALEMRKSVMTDCILAAKEAVSGAEEVGRRDS